LFFEVAKDYVMCVVHIMNHNKIKRSNPKLLIVRRPL